MPAGHKNYVSVRIQNSTRLILLFDPGLSILRAKQLVKGNTYFKLKRLGIFLTALILATLYAGLIGLVTYPLRATLISWPIWFGLFYFILDRFNLVRFDLFASLQLIVL